MKRLTLLFCIARKSRESSTGLSNFMPLRGLKFQTNLKWVHPERKSIFHPSNTGDLSPMPEFPENIPRLELRKSEEITSAEEKVKKVFSLDFSLPRHKLAFYKEELMNKVRKHPYDSSSDEVKIARMTAEIRFFQPVLLNSCKNKNLACRIKELIDARKKKLKILRFKDYKRFEWLLEKLNLEYRPIPLGERTITRKKSLVLLARLKIEKQKEEKIAELKKCYDEKKVPYLEKKVKQLKWIKEMEIKNGLPSTVSDDDIEKCTQKIEKVKAEVAERMKMGYLRKIHPYFLEPFHEKLLNEKEDVTLDKEVVKQN